MKTGMQVKSTPKTARQRIHKGTFKRIMKYIAVYKWQFSIVIVSIIMSAVVSILASVFVQILVDNYIEPLIGVANPDFTGFATAIITLAGVFLLGTITAFLSNRLMINISEKAMNEVRKDLFNHMQTLPIRFYDTNATGDLMSRFTNDTDTLRQMIQQALPQLISAAISVTGVFVAMLIYSWMLTLVVVVLMVMMILVAGKIGGRAGKYFIKQQASIGKLNGYVEEMIEGQKVIKVFNHEEKAKADFDVINEELYHNASKANIFSNILMPIMMNFSNLIYVFVAIVGAVVVIALGQTVLNIPGVTDLTMGKLIAFLMLTKALSHPLGTVSQQLNAYIMALAGADRIFSMMDERAEKDEGSIILVRAGQDGAPTSGRWYWKRVTQESVEFIDLKGDVRFNDVSFGYVPEKVVLKNVTLYAKQGQKIAFVGSTGAGKTTITNLINRFYDIDSGVITYDGIDVKDIKKESLRRSLGIVLQDTHLFTGSVLDNIRYGRLDATDEECKEAAILANADYFIRHLTHGYDTVLTGDGANLSQGQRQLLAIARASVADAPVLILDEATSSIDTRTEALIEKGMDSLMAGRTVFVIAHRLSTVRNSKAIMVLENGEVIERGDHENLLTQKGKYYQMYTGKFELA